MITPLFYGVVNYPAQRCAPTAGFLMGVMMRYYCWFINGRNDAPLGFIGRATGHGIRIRVFRG